MTLRALTVLRSRESFHSNTATPPGRSSITATQSKSRSKDVRGGFYDLRLHQGCSEKLPDEFFSDSALDPFGGRVEEPFEQSIGEFDPGSGRTLAACLTHASQGGPQG